MCIDTKIWWRKRNRRSEGKELEEKKERFEYKTEVESSESEAETEMTHMFQLGEMRRKLKISRKVEQKEMPDPGEEGRGNQEEEVCRWSNDENCMW